MMKSSLIIVLFGAFVCLSSAQTRDCPRNCLIAYRCNPYVEDLVWSIVDGTCRVFQNGCLFASKNCSRLNSCKNAMVKTTRARCQRRCNEICPFGGSGVCATFVQTNADNSTQTYEKTFLNTCLLNQYACKNAKAYISTSEGECRTGTSSY